MNDPVNYVDLWGLEGCPTDERVTPEDVEYEDLDNASGINFLAVDTDPDGLYQSANNIPDKDGVFVVVGHGNVGNFRDANGDLVSPETLANTIKNNKNYDEGDAIKLLSCLAGVDTGGEGDDSYAQQLADAMGLGEVVMGANKPVWILPSGNIWIADPDTEGQGPSTTLTGEFEWFTGK